MLPGPAAFRPLLGSFCGPGGVGSARYLGRCSSLLWGADRGPRRKPWGAVSDLRNLNSLIYRKTRSRRAFGAGSSPLPSYVTQHGSEAIFWDFGAGLSRGFVPFGAVRGLWGALSVPQRPGCRPFPRFAGVGLRLWRNLLISQRLRGRFWEESRQGGWSSR